MAVFLFWNMNRKPALDCLAALVREHRVDVLVLAECTATPVDLLLAVNAAAHHRLAIAPGPPPHRLRILTTLPTGCCRALYDGGSIAVRHLVPPVGQDLILVAVHLASKLHKDEISQGMHCALLNQDIEDAEDRIGHRRTVVVGDLNMNPFEFGVACAGGIHAVMTRSIAARKSRIVQRKPRPFFYNPMWSFFGDLSPGPPGTYYYDTGNELNYYWNMFDQVLVRPELLPMFDHGTVRILVSAGSMALLSDKMQPQPSDHLPLVFELNLQKEDHSV